jgi:phosphomannomutase
LRVDQAFIKSSIENASFNTPAEERKLKCGFHFITWDFHHPSSDTLSKAGYTNVHIVPEQAVPNGDFPTVKSPNPKSPKP